MKQVEKYTQRIKKIQENGIVAFGAFMRLFSMMRIRLNA